MVDLTSDGASILVSRQQLGGLVGTVAALVWREAQARRRVVRLKASTVPSRMGG